MPRVVPTQVVTFIETKFPWAQAEGPPEVPPATPLFQHEMLALSRLVGNVPEELLRLGPEEYADLMVGMAAIERASMEIGEARLFRVSEATGVWSLYHLLQKCPDSFPPPIAKDPAFITDLNLREDLHRDIGEVEHALHNGEWKAATVLAGSVVETLLLWACQNRPDPAALAGATDSLKIVRPIERWDLAELMSVAHALKLISDRTRNAVEQARDYRNLIHPGKAQRLSMKCNRGTALLSVGAIEAVVVDLS